MMLSEHFSLEELTRSATAQKLGIVNSPNDDELKNLQILCLQVLEPARRAAGNKPFHISSGYRCKELNRQVGGVPGSYHVMGRAADIVCYNSQRARKVADCLNMQPLTDLVLIEVSKSSMWIHVQWSTHPRHKCNYHYSV